jgi:uncharacterized membrane protein YhhN
MKKIFLSFFYAISLAELVAILSNSDALEKVCKPLIMISLGVYYFSSVRRDDRSSSLVLAIFFSFLGDVLLMIQQRESSFFMFGLLAFLLSHIFYILTYRQHINKNEGKGLQGIQKARFSFPFILAGSGLVVVLYPFLGDLRVPVMFYALVLILMVLNALFRYEYTNTKSFWMVFAGATLFMASDSLLAINKFLNPIQHGVFWIMLTYICAQFLIVRGLIEHHRRS